MKINDRDFNDDPPESWGEKKKAIEAWDFPHHELLIGWVEGYQEEVFIRVVTDDSRPEPTVMSNHGFDGLSVSAFGDLIHGLIDGSIPPGGSIGVDP